MAKSREKQLEAVLLQILSETKSGGNVSVTSIRSAEILLRESNDNCVEMALYDNAISHLEHPRFAVSCLAESYIHQYYCSNMNKAQLLEKLKQNQNISVSKEHIEYADLGEATIFKFNSDQSVILEVSKTKKLIALHSIDELQDNIESPYIELLFNLNNSPFVSKSEI